MPLLADKWIWLWSTDATNASWKRKTDAKWKTISLSGLLGLSAIDPRREYKCLPAPVSCANLAFQGIIDSRRFERIGGFAENTVMTRNQLYN